ncbi:MAG: LacI family DNA-binding transcriptional regulator [Paenibacillaceae bacterium]|nr:LacI family DNA-binding transcriptional regulator [Paenibacillaceae bacterium]
MTQKERERVTQKERERLRMTQVKMMTTKRYTMKMIAEELGVSISTVERVINKRGGIGPDTEKRVRDFVEAVGFRPNQVGRSLVRNKEKHIHILFHANDNEFLEDLKHGVAAAEEELVSYGFVIHTHVVHKNSAEQLRVLKQIVREGADGVALSPYEPEKFVDLVNELVDQGLPVITLNNDIPESRRLCYVGSDYTATGYLAGEMLGKLVKQGKVLVIQHWDYWHQTLRLTGFRNAMREFPGIEVMGPFDSDREMDLYSYLQHFSKQENSADIKGIFSMVGNRGENANLCMAIKELYGKSVDVVTYDLNSECVYWMQEGVITATVTQDPFAQGFYAAKILSRLLSGDNKISQSVYHTKIEIVMKGNIHNYLNNYKLALL